ncbi:ABC transporter substrate-binding protein [Halocatena pleomorpha]|uniref:ABC transporter substrate-binding protein n=1 Tax=Halocatena pleomorpha TaxID=1785090 RepID=A0A3P3R7K2_9EURY|nr:ABC transporter substrate-binding protein [Halocatena pleomorpha]RRJ28909.1 ABC transporter substrate-binding protein [Halocatena pleomorpha]
METDGTHSRRTFLKAAGATMATVSVAGCTGSPKDTSSGGGDGPSGTLMYSRGARNSTLDIHVTTSGEDVKVTNQIYDKLIDFKPGQNQITGSLAKEYTLDGTTASLTLREGVKFHNGDEFTAQDFEATYRRLTDPEYKHYIGKKNVSAYSNIVFGQIKSVSVVGDYELEIELTKKFAPFFRNLAIFAGGVLPKSEIESGTDFSTTAIGTGPFTLDQYEQNGRQIRLRANENYWNDGPEVSKVIFSTVGENSTRVSQLISGKTHIIDGIDPDGVSRIENNDGVSVQQKVGLNVGYLALNMERMKPFRKKSVRKAMNYAINTKVIVEEIFSGLATQSSQPIPESVMGYNENIDPYPHDPQQAKTLLKEAGHGNGFNMELAVFKNPRPYIPSPIQTAEQVKSDLSAVGINAEISQMSWEPYLEYTQTGKHDACFLGWNTDNGDPDNFYYPLLHPAVESPDGQDWVSFDTDGYQTTNASGWANQEFMSSVEEARSITGSVQEREGLYREAGKLAHDEAPWVFLDHTNVLRGVSNSVSDYNVSAVGGPFLRTVSVE